MTNLILSIFFKIIDFFLGSRILENELRAIWRKKERTEKREISSPYYFLWQECCIDAQVELFKRDFGKFSIRRLCEKYVDAVENKKGMDKMILEECQNRDSFLRIFEEMEKKIEQLELALSEKEAGQEKDDCVRKCNELKAVSSKEKKESSSFTLFQWKKEKAGLDKASCVGSCGE